MESFFQDVRYALRLLRNSPGFTAVAVITLALGIGANTAIFSVVNTVLLRPLPYQQPERLAMIWQSYPVSGFDRLGASAPEYIDYRDRSHSFSNVAAYAGLSFNLTADQQKPDRIRAARVTGNMFPLLGVAPYLGRTVSPEDDRAGGPKVAVLSYALWQQHFNSDREILGRSVRLDENPYTVIGVMPPSFKFPFDGTPLSDRADIWVPMAFSKYEVESRAVSYDFRVLARLKDGVSLEQARAEIQGIAAAMVADNPAVYPSKMRLDAKVSSFGGDIVANIKPALLVLLGAVGFVLLIACANIANLLLARASRRAREIAVRTAIGASPGRLVRQALTESLTLAVIGGGLGLLLANSAISLIARFGPADLPRVRDVRIEPVVLLFTVCASLLTGLIFGLAPALRSARVNLNQALKEAGQATGEGSDKHRSRNLLVMVETASAVLLLFGAGLLLNSFVRVLHVSPGFEPGGLLMARTAFDRNRYPDPVKRRDVQRELLRRFQALPGVETVGLSVTLPLRDDRGIGFRIEGHDPTEFHHAKNDLVNNEYFRAMAIPVIQG
ncbi:MAG TPA: ADOP family duplicated permease, partial [Alphaproteobacteria bacterium]|nr:ADOP family duplicated permease [Alphaproteobacteria bacterium]